MNTSIINTYILLSLIILFIIPVVECRQPILTCTNGDVDEEDEDIRRLLLSEGMQKKQGTRVIAVYSYQVDRNECKLLLMQ